MHDYQQLTANFETISDFLRFGITEAIKQDLIFGHGTDNAKDDIQWLILESLYLPFDAPLFLLQTRLTAPEKLLLAKQLTLRIQERMPTAYLVKKAYFCGLSFYVDQRVLIPRSPIAELINKRFSPWLEEDKVEQILDLCTGSACIAIACAYAFPSAMITAVDISQDALNVAAINCEQHEVEEQVECVLSNIWENVAKHKKFNLIISNPPYVDDIEMSTLPEEYKHEPELALRANQQGLAIIEEILAHAHEYLTDNGILVVETGNSELALVEAYPQVPFVWLEFEQGGQGVFLLTAEQLKRAFKSSTK